MDNIGLQPPFTPPPERPSVTLPPIPPTTPPAPPATPPVQPLVQPEQPIIQPPHNQRAKKAKKVLPKLAVGTLLVALLVGGLVLGKNLIGQKTSVEKLATATICESPSPYPYTHPLDCGAQCCNKDTQYCCTFGCKDKSDGPCPGESPTTGHFANSECFETGCHVSDADWNNGVSPLCVVMHYWCPNGGASWDPNVCGEAVSGYQIIGNRVQEAVFSQDCGTEQIDLICQGVTDHPHRNRHKGPCASPSPSEQPASPSPSPSVSSPSPSPSSSLTTIPNCTSLITTADLNNLQVGTEYSFQLTAGGTAPITSVEMSVYGSSCSNNLKTYTPQTVSGPGTYTIKWTPTQAGSFTAYGRIWNDGVAECRADCVDGPPRYLCANAQACKLTGTVTSPTTISCVELTKNTANPKLNDAVPFVCNAGYSSPSLVAFFRYSTNGGSTYSDRLPTNGVVINPGAYRAYYTITIGQIGNWVVQCRICTSAAATTCTAWGQAN